MRYRPLAAEGSALADEAQRFKGLFCNTEAQIDQALADIAAGVSARRAAELANRDAVVCTGVDRSEYLIARPIALGNTMLQIVKYRGVLVGVLVGDALRPVTPEANATSSSRIGSAAPPPSGESEPERAVARCYKPPEP